MWFRCKSYRCHRSTVLNRFIWLLSRGNLLMQFCYITSLKMLFYANADEYKLPLTSLQQPNAIFFFMWKRALHRFKIEARMTMELCFQVSGNLESALPTSWPFLRNDLICNPLVYQHEISSESRTTMLIQLETGTVDPGTTPYVTDALQRTWVTRLRPFVSIVR